MPNTHEFSVDHLSAVTDDDLSRFTDTVKILNAKAFKAELQAFMNEYVEAVQFQPMHDRFHREVPQAVETVEQSLARKAFALRSGTRWVPGETDIQRGRAMLLEAFDQPHNLPLTEFARLANKSRQQIYKDIDAHRLLALNVGPRRQKLPDWQLDPVKQALTQAVLKGADDVDAWTLYRALSEPLEGLGGRSPVDAVTADSVNEATRSVFTVLGIH